MERWMWVDTLGYFLERGGEIVLFREREEV